MGNHASCIGNYSEKTIQVVCSDGTVRILQKTVSAGQIMQEFPQHLVCHSDSLYIGQKTLALSQNDQLKVGNKYFVLPDHFFQCPLSLASLISPTAPHVPTSPISRVSSPLRNIGREAALCQPFKMENSNVGAGLRIRVSADFITKIMEDGSLNSDQRGHPVIRNSADNEKYGLCNSPELQRDYAQLVTSRGQSWKPKLETISEKERSGGYKRFMKIKRWGQKQA